MGWWEIGDTNDVIGDGPADIMIEAFKIIVASHRKKTEPVLTLQQFLNAIFVALKRKPEKILLDGDKMSLRRIVVELDTTPTRITTSSDENVDEQVASALFKAFKEIKSEYEDLGLDRKPKISELLETIDFVLGYRSKDYENITENIAFKRIFAEYD